MSEWLAVEAIVRQRDKEKTASAVAKLSSESSSDHHHNKAKGLDIDGEIENDVFEENGFSDLSDPDEECEIDDKVNEKPMNQAIKPNRISKASTDSGNVPDDGDDDKDMVIQHETIEEIVIDTPESPNLELKPKTNSITMEDISNKSTPSSSSYETVPNDFVDSREQMEAIASVDMEVDPDENNEEVVPSPTAKHHAVIITDASIDMFNIQNDGNIGEEVDSNTILSPLPEEVAGQTSLDALQEPKSACVSPASSNGGIYSVSHQKNH